MTYPQIIRTPAGEELVVLPRSEYDAMIAALEEAAEDAADAAIGVERLADIAAGAATKMTPAESAGALGYLRSARRARGMTQQQLAEICGITQGALSDIESGRRNGSPAVMLKLAAALDVPPAQFGLSPA
jgi:DNA-binding XRE family transcriptional regulator